jgi:homoserine kinase
MSGAIRAAAVRVPCSTSNLGAGYDTIGLALDRYLDAGFEPGGSELTLSLAGSLERMEHAVDEDILVIAFRKRLAEVGIEPTGRVALRSDIPIARGLGSSAAAALAGYDLADAVRGAPTDQLGAFRSACASEGHGDNAAPCLYGGLRAVAPGSDGPVAIELSLSPEVGFAYAAPAAGIATTQARDVLPSTVPHDGAARSLGRLAALIHGLETADPELLRIGAEDELHVPHRLPMIPGAYNAIGAGYDAGAWAVTISGAGSGLIALCPLEAAAGVAEAMREILCTGVDHPECVGFAARPEMRGLRRMESQSD